VSSEFGKQHVDVSRAEAIWCIEACKLAGDRLAFGTKSVDFRPPGGLPATPDWRRASSGPTPLYHLRDRAVAGVASGGAEVGRRVDIGAAAEAVRTGSAGEHVVARTSAQPVVTGTAG